MKIAARNLDYIHKDIIDGFNKLENTFFVFERTYNNTLLKSPVLPFELAVAYNCLCLDFDSFWALRQTRNNNRWLVWDKNYEIPDYIAKEAILTVLYTNPPVTLDPEIKEVMGVPVEKMA